MGLLLSPSAACEAPCAGASLQLQDAPGGRAVRPPRAAAAAAATTALDGAWHQQFLCSEASRALLTHVRSGDALRVQATLRGLAVPDCCDAAGASPLHAAVDGGHAEIVRMLLRRGATPDAPAGPVFGGPPSQLAASRGHAECLELLLGARAGLDTRGGPRGGTALHAAAAAGHARCARAVLAADPATAAARARGGIEHTILRPADLVANVLDDGGRLALHDAVSGECPQCAALLLEEGMSLTDVADADGDAPIHAAAVASSQATGVVLCRLLAGASADLDAPSACGDRALHLAAMHGLAEVIGALLGAAACPDLAEGTRGRTPLHFAAKAGSAEACAALLAGRADPLRLDGEGKVALTCATSKACKEAISASMLRAERGGYEVAADLQGLDGGGGVAA